MSDFLTEMEAIVPALRRFARALVRNADGADDLVQSTLERALKRRALWRGEGSLKAWLFTIMRNIHRNELRRLRRRPIHMPIDGEFNEPSQPENQIDHVYFGEVMTALDTLSDDHREILLFAAVEGLSYREMSDVVGIPIGTVMSRLSRARDALASRLDGSAAPHLRSIK